MTESSPAPVETVYHQCPTCGTMNTGTDPDAVLYCGQTACGWDVDATDAVNHAKAPKLVLLDRDAVKAYYHDRAPVGLPDVPKHDPQPRCAACGSDLPFVVPTNAPRATSWRCSDACSLAIVAPPVIEPQRGLKVG